MNEVGLEEMFQYRKQRYECKDLQQNHWFCTHKKLIQVYVLSNGSFMIKRGSWSTHVNRLSRKLTLERDFAKFIQDDHLSYVINNIGHEINHENN